MSAPVEMIVGGRRFVRTPTPEPLTYEYTDKVGTYRLHQWQTAALPKPWYCNLRLANGAGVPYGQSDSPHRAVQEVLRRAAELCYGSSLVWRDQLKEAAMRLKEWQTLQQAVRDARNPRIPKRPAPVPTKKAILTTAARAAKKGKKT